MSDETSTPLDHMILGVIAFDQQPSADAVAEAIRDRLPAAQVMPVNPERPGLVPVNYAGLTILSSIQPTAFGGQTVEQFAHPAYCASGVPGGQSAHVVVMLSPAMNTEFGAAGLDPRSTRTAQLLAHSEICAAIAGIDGALGVYSEQTKTTYSTDFYRAYAGDQPSPLIGAVWLSPGSAGTVSGYSCGLIELGHPEIQVSDYAGDPQALFESLSAIVSYIVAGNTLKDGDTLGLDDSGSATISAADWLMDAEVPAVSIAGL